MLELQPSIPPIENLNVAEQGFVRECLALGEDINIGKILSALRYMKQKHEGQYRSSGEPFSTHPLMVALTLLEISFSDEEAIIAALLHDIEEDQPGNLEEIGKKFGKEVQKLVENLTKLDILRYKGRDHQIGTLRKLFIAMAQDSRVVFIKLADRLHNMRTLQYLEPERQSRIAQETLEVYAPIAGRLGIYHMKVPLENLAFYYLHRREYESVSKAMSTHEAQRDQVINSASQKLERIAKKMNLSARITGRTKHLYSIHKKMYKKRMESIEEINDIFALRVIVPKIEDCYALLGAIHQECTPLAGRFKDYIALPKPNNYRSLHTTVVGLAGSGRRRSMPVEVQIRTEQMHRESEYGIAAHWSYKEESENETLKKSQEWLQSLVETAEGSMEESDSTEALYRDALQTGRTYALTPHGDIIDMPLKATVIDFAFAIHSDLGIRLKAAKANGKIVPLPYQIESGDMIEILTHREPKPSRNWLNIVATSRARQKLHQYFREQDRPTLIRQGRELLNKQLQRYGLKDLDQNITLLTRYGGRVVPKSEREGMLARMGSGALNPVAVIQQILSEQEERPKKQERAEKGPQKSNQKAISDAIIIEGEEGMRYRIANCCKPQPGDQIAAFITRGRYLTIHKKDCPVLQSLPQDRVLRAWYKGQEPTETYKILILRDPKVREKGFLQSVLLILAKEDMDVREVISLEQGARSSSTSLTVESGSLQKLNEAMDEIEALPQVQRVQVLG